MARRELTRQNIRKEAEVVLFLRFYKDCVRTEWAQKSRWEKLNASQEDLFFKALATMNAFQGLAETRKPDCGSNNDVDISTVLSSISIPDLDEWEVTALENLSGASRPALQDLVRPTRREIWDLLREAGYAFMCKDYEDFLHQGWYRCSFSTSIEERSRGEPFRLVRPAYPK